MIAHFLYQQPFPFDTIFVPPVRLEAAYLIFQPQGPLRPSSGKMERLVYDFTHIAEGSDETVLQFALRWGVLGICRHGRTLQHREPMCLPRRSGHESAEAIGYWRTRARHVQSILNVKAALDKDQIGGRADWKTIWPGRVPTDREDAAKTLAIVASFLLSEASVQPMLHYARGQFAITFIGGNLRRLMETRFEADAGSRDEQIGQWLSSSGSLLAQIAVRTVLAIQSDPGWATCSNPDCGRLYRPRRHVAEGRLHFCQDCGRRASWRLSKRRRSAARRR